MKKIDEKNEPWSKDANIKMKFIYTSAMAKVWKFKA